MERRIRAAAKLVRLLSRTPAGLRLVRTLRSLPLAGAAHEALLGYHRPFASLREANEAVAPYARQGHENPRNADLHLELSGIPRPSDYAALFHIQRVLPTVRRVFDLGGNVGNLFYLYSSYLDLPPGLVWQVHDLPANVARGEELAKQRGADRLRFTRDWRDASGADLLIASGSLHYFDRPLPDMVAELEEKPPFILVNRTPLTSGTPAAAVQDTGDFRVACMVHNRAKLIGAFEAIGYDFEDGWEAAELSLVIPGYPEHSAPSYTGLFFRKRQSVRALAPDH